MCLIDDVLVYGKSAAEHDDQSDKVGTDVHEKAGKTINKEKSQLSQNSIMFLGQLTDESDPGKVIAIQTVL